MTTSLKIMVIAPKGILPHLTQALEAMGLSPVAAVDPTQTALPPTDGIQVFLVVLSPEIESSLEQMEDFLYSDGVEVLFDEAENRETWNQARWEHHLHGKMMAIQQRAKKAVDVIPLHAQTENGETMVNSAEKDLQSSPSKTGNGTVYGLTEEALTQENWTHEGQFEAEALAALNSLHDRPDETPLEPAFFLTEMPNAGKNMAIPSETSAGNPSDSFSEAEIHSFSQGVEAFADEPLGGMILFDDIAPIPVLDPLPSSAKTDSLPSIPSDPTGLADPAPAAKEKTSGSIQLAFLDETSESAPVSAASTPAPTPVRTFVDTGLRLEGDEQEVKEVPLPKTQKEHPPAAPQAPLQEIETEAFSSPMDDPLPEAEGLIILLGGSGGPAALRGLVPHLHRRLPVPVVVFQHLPQGHYDAFAANLQRDTAIPVRVVQAGQTLHPGEIHVFPDNLGVGEHPDGGFEATEARPSEALWLAGRYGGAVVLVSGVDQQCVLPVMEAMGMGALVLGQDLMDAHDKTTIQVLSEMGLLTGPFEAIGAHLADRWGLVAAPAQEATTEAG